MDIQIAIGPLRFENGEAGVLLAIAIAGFRFQWAISAGDVDGMIDELRNAKAQAESSIVVAPADAIPPRGGLS